MSQFDHHVEERSPEYVTILYSWSERRWTSQSSFYLQNSSILFDLVSRQKMKWIDLPRKNWTKWRRSCKTNWTKITMKRNRRRRNRISHFCSRSMFLLYHTLGESVLFNVNMEFHAEPRLIQRIFILDRRDGSIFFWASLSRCGQSISQSKWVSFLWNIDPIDDVSLQIRSKRPVTMQLD